jgi:predicted nucleic acid-binding Zn ribbon protein
MRGNNTNNVGDIIRKLMKNPKLAEKMDELDALDVWKELIGDNLKKFVVSAKVHKGNLHVKLSSSVLRNELSYKKSELKEKINQKLGKEIVKEIILK